MHKFELDPWFVDKAKAARDGRQIAYQQIVAAKTALVVVDMQNYFVKEGMPSYTPVAQLIVPNINRLASAVRAAGGIVVWVQTEAYPDIPSDWDNRREATSDERWSRRQQLLARNGSGFPIYQTCDVQDADKIAIKSRYSAFIPTPSDLHDQLVSQGVDTMLITGVATSSCCDSTARDASMWGYRTIMVSDGNADQTDALHNHTLGKFLVTFGDVQSTDELVAKLTST